MLTAMPAPTFSLDFSSPYKPNVSSPLSSSPIRAAVSSSQSSPSAPLSPRDSNRCNLIQSSPIPALKLFKYASRPAKSNPLRQTRENAQESRRKLFLKNVRQRQDDRQWERRGGDQEVLKLEWQLLNRQRRLQKESDIDGFVFEEEIDEDPSVEAAAATTTAGDYSNNSQSDDIDSMMLDAMEQDEDAMLSMYEADARSTQPQQQQQRAPPRPDSPFFLSDDEDYDNIFMDLLSHTQRGNITPHDFPSSSDMDMS
ncbi:uncharacterized protein PG998_001845 [Apiospora kogelbergensis]|uniref:uncharacterized protein n=1 Tax=Apiospora kogelbergensis TaxID=1337665 RepID=UPI00313133CC